VSCQHRRIEAGRIIIAAGLGTRKLASYIGMDVPVAPQRGQIMVTARMEKFLDFPTLTIRQTDNGSVMIGESWENIGFDDRTTPSVLNRLAQRAVRMMPVLATAPVIRTWAALRVLTPDGLPIYQESNRYPGAFVATCHSGVTLTAFHAGPLADAIASTTFGDDLADFGADRFHVH
jgi:glycine/D-amino acid oxidase-like deaminating enzyme